MECGRENSETNSTLTLRGTTDFMKPGDRVKWIGVVAETLLPGVRGTVVDEKKDKEQMILVR